MLSKHYTACVNELSEAGKKDRKGFSEYMFNHHQEIPFNLFFKSLCESCGHYFDIVWPYLYSYSERSILSIHNKQNASAKEIETYLVKILINHREDLENHCQDYKNLWERLITLNQI